ncbi:hypothetical protein [Raoultella ornithinolytica]|uniref:hypothetical protein n=1 Tax=Raoultella ornithinolytica TaxID=54291 RepID=UPI00374E110C
MSELTAALATIEKCREITNCPAGVDLQDWVKQLAAENVGLKSFGDTLFDMYKGLEISGGGIHDEQSVVCQQAALDAAMSAFEEIEPPATDRIVAEAEARGVEKFAAKLRIPGDDQFFDALAKGVAIAADDFAKQLREGAKLASPLISIQVWLYLGGFTSCLKQASGLPKML